MAFQTNRFCWYGCISTDTDVAKTFYSEVLGWGVTTVPMGDDDATFFAAGGKKVAHLAAPPMDGVPSHWNNYLRVEDVDASSAKAVENGGKQLVAPTDIPPGRFSVVSSPSGATFSLFHEASDDSEHHPGGEGSVHWVELHSKDLSADLAWLTATFGFTTDEMDMPDGKYTILKSGDEMRGGAMASTEEKAPSMWLTWMQVGNVDETVARVGNHNGNVLSPAFDVPNIGRMAVVQDPAGGVFGVITPAT